MPKPPGPTRASPDTFIITRRDGGSAMLRNPGSLAARYRLAFPPSRCSHLSRKIGVGAIDTLAESVAYESCNFNRRPRSVLGLFDGLGNALVRLVDKGLIEETNLSVERLET